MRDEEGDFARFGGLIGGVTQWYSPSAVYAITPTSRQTAYAIGQASRPAPVQRWELPTATEDEADDEILEADPF